MKQKVTSKKAFLEKVKEGYRLESSKEYKRTVYYLWKGWDYDQINVPIGLVRKLEEQKIIDINLDVISS